MASHRPADEVTPARIVLGSLVIALALSAAIWLHAPSTRLGSSTGTSCKRGGFVIRPGELSQPCPASKIYSYKYRPSWQTTLAAFIAIAGLGVGAAIIASGSLRARAE